MDGPWGSSSGNNNPGSGGGFSGGGHNKDSIDDLLNDLKWLSVQIMINN